MEPVNNNTMSYEVKKVSEPIAEVQIDLFKIIETKTAEITKLQAENAKLKYGMDDLWFEESWLDSYLSDDGVSYNIPDYYINRFRALVTAQHNEINSLKDSLNRRADSSGTWR